MEAHDVISLELQSANMDAVFPAFEAGAHIDLHLKPGLTRSYSLINPGEAGVYRVAVQRAPNSRGGSEHVHQNLRVGQEIAISVPRNHFQLDHSAQHSVLIAGGIGITPIFSMLKSLCKERRRVTVLYCAKSEDNAAYLMDVIGLAQAAKGDGVVVDIKTHFSHTQGRLDLFTALAGYDADTHFYCCGPASMIDAYQAACERHHYKHVHWEHFGGTSQKVRENASDCTVELRRSGRELVIPAEQSILDGLLSNGVQVDHSCREGVCGACEVCVLEGEVEHLDHVLSKAEQAANRSMMVCVSRVRSGRLALDL